MRRSARHQRQQPHALDPDADRGQVHRQQQIALPHARAAASSAGAPPPSAGSARWTASPPAPPRTASPCSSVEIRMTCAGAAQISSVDSTIQPEAEAELVGQRADADVVADQHVEEHRADRGARCRRGTPGRRRAAADRAGSSDMSLSRRTPARRRPAPPRPTSTPANAERRINRNARKPTPAPRAAPTSGTPASAPGGISTMRATTAGDQRGRHPPHPQDDLGFLVEPAAEHDAEPAPDLARQEADQDQDQIGLQLARSCCRRSGVRCTRCRP